MLMLECKRLKHLTMGSDTAASLISIAEKQTF